MQCSLAAYSIPLMISTPNLMIFFSNFGSSTVERVALILEVIGRPSWDHWIPFLTTFNTTVPFSFPALYSSLLRKLQSHTFCNHMKPHPTSNLRFDLPYQCGAHPWIKRTVVGEGFPSGALFVLPLHVWFRGVLRHNASFHAQRFLICQTVQSRYLIETAAVFWIDNVVQNSPKFSWIRFYRLWCASCMYLSSSSVAFQHQKAYNLMSIPRFVSAKWQYI
jgi:hypothetical protein